MKVILHADDFGFDSDTTSATIELLESGALSSASIMATMPAADEAMAYAAKHPEYSFGVHMTYVDGLKPAVLGAETSLTDEYGLFYPSNDVRKKAILFKLKIQEIVEESLAQIEKVRVAGVKISHLDSHGHLHKFPSFLAALSGIKKKSGIQRVRRVQNIFLQKPGLSPTTMLNSCFDWRIANSCKTTDYFYMSANNMDTGWADAIIAQMDILSHNAVIEVGIHPGHADTDEERWRIAEYNDIKDFASKLKANGNHQIITWNEI